jgi:hypothetical protein
MVYTTSRWGLDRAEAATTVMAVIVSSGLYVAWGHAYLARGVLGDLAGLGLLSLVAFRRQQRLRHEALLCLGCIAAVMFLDPRWPLRISGGVWWSAVAAAVVAYLGVRRWALCR